MSTDFQLLLVCTGNVCRSPFAEALFRDRFRDTQEIRFVSAGTDALVGEGMFEATRLTAARYGLADSGEHKARQLTAADLEAADLILVMTAEQRKQVVELSPRTTRRVFTLREFARLAAVTSDGDLRMEIGGPDVSDAEKLRGVVRAVALARGALTPLTRASELDVVDPYRQAMDVHAVSAQQIVEATNAVVDLFSRALRVAP
ncbi:arsenate reductase/protein-tyrosine-phosphatase family protein [Corynebacterium guangdongense]|uniref:Protein-tyrosine phosphatase n=1 Tax=Corynebacterium guangdongense TaxID=1783348 RepID=A0ABU1ZY93_9CORY|nr:low molecular weight phosphatase family protein [Corynebacterium guangdongense]MDR7329909.1 protein-tyrosine phosphatase [Corynebacterium guangdongense]WJZ18467.1 Low molecular weight protein-tyrosine-phosphatase ptp [Corynebacterium guangdongense]